MKIAIVTGGSAGIGQAASRELALRGMGVVLTYGDRADDADATIKEIEAAGGSAAALQLDVADTASFPAFVEQVVRTLDARWDTDRFDVLVNNAGIGGGEVFEKVTEDMFDRLHATLFRGPYSRRSVFCRCCLTAARS